MYRACFAFSDQSSLAVNPLIVKIFRIQRADKNLKHEILAFLRLHINAVRAFVSAFRSDRKLIIDMHYEIDALFVSEFICYIASVLIIFTTYSSKRVIMITRTAKAVITAIVLKFSPVIGIVFRMICLNDRLKVDLAAVLNVDIHSISAFLIQNRCPQVG